MIYMRLCVCVCIYMYIHIYCGSRLGSCSSAGPATFWCDMTRLCVIPMRDMTRLYVISMRDMTRLYANHTCGMTH